LLRGATTVFGGAPKTAAEPAFEVKTRHAMIEELTLENFLCPARAEKWACRRAQEKTDPTEKPSVSRQSIGPGASAGSVHYMPHLVWALDLKLMPGSPGASSHCRC
jgi:hypothetical protein